MDEAVVTVFSGPLIPWKVALSEATFNVQSRML